MRTILRFTGKQHKMLIEHLLPADGNEAVAIALCGRRNGVDRHCLSVHKIILIPHTACFVRKHGLLTWPTDLVMQLLPEATKHGMAILKIHSHPGGYADFSQTDDEADAELFASIHNWIDDGLPHASAVMLPGGEIFGRAIMSDGSFEPLASISVAGDDLFFFRENACSHSKAEAMTRNKQAFGDGTIDTLRRLTVAVAGCSGTGSIIVEQLVRLGVGTLVLVDFDLLEEKNLNRIVNSTMGDALIKKPKVIVLAEAIERIGLGTKIRAITKSLFDKEAFEEVAGSDVIFGCLDSIDGRNLLNRIASYYNIPYFDLGVRLDADGVGGIEQICGTVHTLQPDGSSLLSRGVYTPEDLLAAGLLRQNPESYEERVKEKYIKGVREERPAVISVNMLIASLAVNEFLARLHRFREDENHSFASFGMSLTQSRLVIDAEGEPCGVLARYAGRGDVSPMLNMPELR